MFNMKKQKKVPFIEIGTPKRAYKSPKLTKFGQVSKLTMGGGSLFPDGGPSEFENGA